MTAHFALGDYSYLPAGFQFSSGVGARPGFEIVRVRFDELLPLADGFDRAAAVMQADGRPLTAFCACELRSPGAFSEDGFRDFNRSYVATLQDWQIYDGGDTNPVARSNVCPVVDPPAVPSMYAFCYTRPRDGGAHTTVISGSAETRDGPGSYTARIVRYRDLSPDGWREKVAHTMATMTRRLGAFGLGWSQATALQAYTIHDIHPVLESEIVRAGAAQTGVTWHYTRPPVVDMEFELDVRRVLTELVV